jgi:23S rRNA (cytidine1920-2'-O)/16S rRNA (cytidine1409-2'-O)-methyltransferase
MKRARLDLWLVAHGLAPTREKAQALVMAGRVLVDEKKAAKAGTGVAEDAHVHVLPGPAHVGRGALKLAGAIDLFKIDVRGRSAVDVGASTGGFTEILLERGARIVYAVDVGRSQLHERLRGDKRVVLVEGQNARNLSEASLPELCGIATVDVSFISVGKILPALKSVLEEGATLLVLVKPQFEVGRFQVGRKGVVKDKALWKEALLGVASEANGLGYGIRGACASALTGAEGNREFFLHLCREGPPVPRESLLEMVDRAVAE